MNNRKNRQKGFTILVAVVTAGVLLIIAMSIGGIALKQQMLSIANKESQIAFYAADTGMECALYWDNKKGAFGPVINPDGSVSDPPGSFDITCVGETFSIGSLVPDNLPVPADQYHYSFVVSNIPVGPVGSGVTTCAVVKVTKNTYDSVNHPSNPSKTYTTIDSRGYNTCGPSLSRLERGITTTY